MLGCRRRLARRPSTPRGDVHHAGGVTVHRRRPSPRQPARLRALSIRSTRCPRWDMSLASMVTYSSPCARNRSSRRTSRARCAPSRWSAPSYSPTMPASTSSRSGVPMCLPDRSNTGVLHSGRGSPASSIQIRRMRVSHGDQLFSSARRMASRHWGMPVHPGWASAYAVSSSMLTRSSNAAMSIATTASRTLSAYRASKHSERTGVVTLTPSCSVRSRGLSRSWETRMPACSRTSSPATASATGASVRPRRPSNQPPPCHRRLAQPVTPPYSGRTTDASMMRCSGEPRSVSAGT